MADALKAEGNKAFSTKDYATAMYVPRTVVDRHMMEEIVR